MPRKVNRREFVVTSAGAGLAAAAQTRTSAQAPAVVRSGVRPVVVASANGYQYKNGGTKTGVEIAFGMIAEGKDVLDAVIAGVNLCELDPEDTSVGYGGLPNADGVVQLDASCMHGPKKRAGAVACIEGVRTPSLVAQKVMSDTDHHLLVGRDAQRFARNLGFTIEDDLNTDRSRAAWLEWKRRTDPARYLDPAKREAALRRVEREMMDEGWVDPNHFYGTINSRPCRRLADSGRGTLRRRRRRRRGLDRARRGESLQPRVVPDRRGNAPRQEPEGRRHGSTTPDQGQHHREASAERARRAELQHQLLHVECQG
jgi:N4-(beta-N-acetylglucosaminyl)-L-asparaginase